MIEELKDWFAFSWSWIVNPTYRVDYYYVGEPVY